MRQVLIAFLLCGAVKAETATAEFRANVTIQLIDLANVPSQVMAQAMAEASSIFETAGVRLNWTQDKPDAAATLQAGCGLPPVAVFTLKIVPIDMAGVSPNANATANARAGSIIVFYHRLKTTMENSRWMVPTFLGYVMAHEIGHLSQVVGKHSPMGIMKANWTSTDYRAMEEHLLQFTPEDIRFIRAGLVFRACPAGSSH